MSGTARAVRRAWIAAPVALLLGVLPAAAQGPEPGLRVWQESFDYQVEVDGKLCEEASLYNAQGRASLLILAPELSQPVVIERAGREVLTVAAESIRRPAPHVLQIDDKEIRGPASPYALDGASVIFYQGGRRVKLVPRPAIEGEVSRETVLARNPAYRRGMDAYLPAESDMFYLRGWKEPIRIDVFFGSWCPTCRVVVPHFLKVVESAGAAPFGLRLVGVPMPPFGDYPPAKEKGVKGVPTFIVYAGDKEIGRFAGVPEGSSVEHELVKILYAHQQAMK